MPIQQHPALLTRWIHPGRIWECLLSDGYYVGELTLRINSHFMLNFATLFNQFRSQSNSGLNDLLDQPNISVGRLLDEDAFLSEYKGNNLKVMDFMNYNRYRELIDYLTVVGDPTDRKRAYKYPLSAADLLSIDNNTTLDFFLPEKPILVEEKVQEEQEIELQVQVGPSPTKDQSPINEPPPSPENHPQEVAQAAQQQNIQDGEKAKQEEPEVKGQEVPEVKGQEVAEVKGSQMAEVKGSQMAQVKGEEASPFKKVLKKIITKQTVQKIVQKQRPALIRSLLDYFNGQVNYTLAGYISKVLMAFFNKKPSEVLKYVLEEGVWDKVLDHAESRSVGDFLVRIITHESITYLVRRADLFKALLSRLSAPADITVMSNLSAYAVEIIQKIAANLKANNKILEFNTAFFSLETVTAVIKNVISDQENVSIYNAPVLLAYLTNVPFVLPEDPEIISNFRELLQTFIQRSIGKLQVTSQTRPKLGVGRLKIIEILHFILKENILSAKELLGAKKDFFMTLLQLMREYSMNNLLHNQVMKIVEIALTEGEGSTLNQQLLGGGALLGWVVREAREEKDSRRGNAVYQTRKGYIAHVINLCAKLRDHSGKSTLARAITTDQEWAGVVQKLLERERGNTSKFLAGYSMRKDLKHEVSFQKEDILNHYLTFLQKCPPSVFETEPEPVNIDHPDLIEELQKELEENLVVKDKDAVQNAKEAVSNAKETTQNVKNAEEVRLDQQEVGHSVNQAKYWVTHLNYDVDDLLADL